MKTFLSIVFYAVAGAIVGHAVGQICVLYEKWPAHGADYVWNHFA